MLVYPGGGVGGGGRERICSDNCTCRHTEIELADPTFYLSQSQYTDTGPTSPSADPITPGAWLARCQYSMTGWGSAYHCPSRSVPEVRRHVAGTLSRSVSEIRRHVAGTLSRSVSEIRRHVAGTLSRSVPEIGMLLGR